jgi:hypothetical protein
MLKVGDLAIQDCSMPYPNTIYRVEEVDEHGNFRGTPVFRLAAPPHGAWKKANGWLGYLSFRKVSGNDEARPYGRLRNVRGWYAMTPHSWKRVGHNLCGP